MSAPTLTTPVGASESSDVEHKEATAAAVLCTRSPHITKVATRLLESFIRHEGDLDTTREPLSHFCRQQVTLAAQDFLKKLKEKTITLEDLRDTFENLTGLHTLVYKKRLDIAKELGDAIHKLTTIMDKVGTALEELSGVPSTDWMGIGDTIVAKTEDVFKREWMPVIPLPTVNDFHSLKLLGTGNFGAVYKVKYTPTNFVCAMKLADSTAYWCAKESCMEKVVASVTKSPFLVKYYACFCARYNTYVSVMEYVRGANLERVLLKVRSLPVDVCRIVMAQLILALEHMHRRGILHRDIKVSNILIMPGGRIKVFDFDTGRICIGHFSKRAFKGCIPKAALERALGDPLGSIPFMAPELLMRQAHGRACDWWSAGVVMYKMTTGWLPFRAETSAEAGNKAFRLPLEWPDVEDHPYSVTPEAKDMVFKLLKRDPAERLGSTTYDEIRQHPFFAAFNWKWVATTKELCTLPAIEECIEEDDKPKLPTVTDPTNLRLKRVQRFEDLEDTADSCEAQAHHLLFTYISPCFHRMMNVPRPETGSVDLDEPFFSSSGSEAEEPDKEAKTDVDINDGVNAYSAAVEPAEQLIATRETMDVALTRTKRLGKYWGFGIDIVQCYGENDTKFFMVERVKKGSPAEAAHVLVSDVIVAVNGQNISELPISEVRRRIQNSGDELTVTVVLSAAGRLLEWLGDCDLILKGALQDTLQVRAIKTTSRRGRNRGFNTIEVKTWNEQRKAFVRCHVIQNVTGVEILSANKCIYPGDVLISVDDVPVGNMGQHGVNAALAKCEGELSITLAPVSPLRLNRPPYTLQHETATAKPSVPTRLTTGNAVPAPE